MTDNQELNADLTQRVVIDTTKIEWQKTDSQGVWRKPLKLVHDPKRHHETSLLRFDPGTELPTEKLTRQTEIFVLEGAISDEHGDYTPKTYLLIPPGERHAPTSIEGCVILITCGRLSAKRQRVVIDVETQAWEPWGHRGGTRVPLHRDEEESEIVYIGNMQPNAHIPDHGHPGGEEIFFLNGSMKDEFDIYRAGTWVHFPDDFRHSPSSLKDGCMLYVRRHTTFF